MADVCDELEEIDTAAQAAKVLGEVELLQQEFDSAHRELRDRYLT